MIEVRDLTTFFGEKAIHAGLNLRLRPGRIHVLMGPSGGGKSSLLKLISQSTPLPQPGVTSGRVTVDGEAGFNPDLFFTVSQKIELFTRTGLDLLVESIPRGDTYTRPQKQQLACDFIADRAIPLTSEQIRLSYSQLPYGKKTVLLCAMAMLGDQPWVFLDEPTSKVDDQEAIEILEVIRRMKEAGKSALVVLHNQKHARHIGDEIHLLAGGRIIESGAASEFFSAPASEITRSFLSTGSCSVPSPDTPEEELSETGRIYRRIFNTESPVPTGFHWLLPGKLAGCMRPGLLCPESDDLSRLQKLGITHLVNLEEEEYLPGERVAEFGIRSIRFPVADMKAPPDVEALHELIERLYHLISGGDRVAIHCKAGLGRTGTVLGCYAACCGALGGHPVEAIRKVNPRWIQSEEQEQFVLHYDHWRQQLLTTTHSNRR